MRNSIIIVTACLFTGILFTCEKNITADASLLSGLEKTTYIDTELFSDQDLKTYGTCENYHDSTDTIIISKKLTNSIIL